MPDSAIIKINKVLLTDEKRMVKKWMANKIKASRLRREVRTLEKQKSAIEKKLSKKVAKVGELRTLIYAGDQQVRAIRARHQIGLLPLVAWFMRRFGPPESRESNPASSSSGSDASSDVASASSDAAIWAISDA